MLMCLVRILKMYFGWIKSYHASCFYMFVSVAKRKKLVSLNTIYFFFRCVTNPAFGSSEVSCTTVKVKVHEVHELGTLLFSLGTAQFPICIAVVTSDNSLGTYCKAFILDYVTSDSSLGTYCKAFIPDYLWCVLERN